MTWAAEGNAKKTDLQGERGLSVQKGIALVVIQFVSSNSQSCSVTEMFIDQHLAHINSNTAQTTWLIHVLVLPRTLPHKYASRAVCVFPFSSREGVLRLVKELNDIF